MKKSAIFLIALFALLLPATLLPQPAPAPKTSLTAKDLEDFFGQVAKLPEQPVGNGRCQLIKIEKAGRTLGICKGECPGNKRCFTAFNVGPGDAIRVRCQCK